MRKVNLTGLVLFTICSLTASIQSSAQQPQNKNQCHEPQLVEFDAPGAATVSSPVCAPFCGTVAYDNNDLGAIVGFYTDSEIVPHGFLRTPDGNFVSFDAPGAGLGAGLNEGTVAYAINDLGVIAGQFQDSSYVYHGFVRHWDGHFTTFDAPGAGTGAGQCTWAWDINVFGTTAGTYVDASNVYHGFVRSPQGVFATFDPTGSILTYVCEETCLTPDGTMAGDFFDSSIVSHGFVRHPNGTFTTFDDPEAGAGTAHPPQGTYPFSINFGGATTGQYFDASYNAHGFERFSDGQFVNFDAPDAAPGSAAGTRPSTNNAEGQVAGWYIDAGGLNHGFLWIP